jgi:hypothetical protein
MKAALLSLILLACTSMLHAQLVPPDTVSTEEEYQYIEDEDDDDDAAEPDSSSSYKPITIHNLISPNELPATKDNANAPMTIRKFDDDKWKKVVGTETFQEKPEKPKKEDKEKDRTTRNLPSIPWNSGVLQIVAYVVVIALIIAIVYIFTKDLRFATKVRPVGLQESNLTAAVENIDDIDVSTPLQKALSESNFKLATRLYFLDLLKKLNQNGYIAWKKDKTNREYLMEVYAKAFCYDEIQKLTIAYELVWYGEHTLSTDTYQRLFAEFESIYQKINTSAAA